MNTSRDREFQARKTAAGGEAEVSHFGLPVADEPVETTPPPRVKAMPVYWSADRREVIGEARDLNAAHGLLSKERSTWHGYAEPAPTLAAVEHDIDHNCFYGVWT